MFQVKISGDTGKRLIAAATSTPRKTPAPTSSFLGEFLTSALHPSPAALGGALSVALLWLLVACLAINENLLRRCRPAALMLDANDSIARLSVVALQGARVHAGEFTVCFLGSSDFQELLPDSPWLANRLSQVLNRSVAVQRFCGSAVILEEQRALLERFGSNFPGTFVIGVGARSLCRPKTVLADRLQRYRLAFRSDTFDAECRHAGLRPTRRTGIDFLDNLRFYLLHTACLPLPWIPQAQFGPHVVQKAEADLHVPAYKNEEWRFDPAEMTRNLEVLGRMIEQIRSAGKAKVVLLEIPWQDDLDGSSKHPGWRTRYEVYHRRIVEFAQQKSVPLLDITSQAALEPADFYNIGHVGKESARHRYGRVLVSTLGSLPATQVPGGAL